MTRFFPASEQFPHWFFLKLSCGRVAPVSANAINFVYHESVQRRDSVRPRERLDSPDVTAAAPAQIDDAVVGAVNTKPRKEEDDDRGTRRELPPPPLPEPDPAHPYPFNVIPVNFFAQRSFEASCLSLAARSTRSSCQSIVDETNLDGEKTTTTPQPVRLRRRRSGHPSSPGDEDINVDRANSVEGSDPSRPISRSASLHRSSGSASNRSLNASGERASITQDDMAIIGVGSGGETRHVRCHSVVDPAFSGVSNADAPKTPLAPVSKTTRHRASGSNSRRSSVSSSHHPPREPMSMAYHLLRELTMTERTYRKDLDVVCANFCSANLSGRFAVDSDVPGVRAVLNRLLNLLEPIRSHHSEFLRGLESRFSNWSGRSASRKSVDAGAGDSTGSCTDAANAKHTANEDTPVSPIRVGDLFVTNLKMLKLYRAYISEVEGLLMDLERLARSRPAFGQKIQEFESQKFCYLPFYAFLLKPMHRLLQYRAILERLMRQYSESHADMQDCRVAHARLLDTIQSQWDSYKRSENLYKILEVERDLVGLQPLPAPVTGSPGVPPPPAATESDAEAGWLARPSRQFVREGLLQKLSKRGYQQRIFFLFSDQLIYASRTNASFLQFKVHGQFHLRDLMVEEAETPLSFTIYSGNRCFLVAAPSEWQRDRWLEDISRAILAAKTSRFSSPLTSFSAALLGEAAAAAAAGAADSSSQNDLRAVNVEEEEDEEEGSGANANRSAGSDGSHAGTAAPHAGVDVSMILHRATTSVHVCWHRSLTFSMSDILRANEYETSGYLLRKFKNSNGWQRLWVVFTQLCMFFHKSYHDTFPLASLPLLGYTITVPEPEDQIRKEFVFKLKFKNHVYFFRDDSQSSFDRWLDCLSSAAENTARQRVTTVRPPPPPSSSS
ncbi:FERM, ARHGEF and pleckstrin domain-containing protein 1 [Sparganum proliferum]